MANDPFTALQTPAPGISTRQASALLREHYGIDATLEPLSSERDQNFMAATTNGEKYVLKFANASEPSAVTDLQIQALLHIARIAPDIPVPRVIPTDDGSLMFEVKSVVGDAHRVRLLSWLDGVPVQRVQVGRDVARQVGACLAQIGRALRDFEHPAGDYVLLWDIRNVASLEKLLPYVNDMDLRKLCESGLGRFRDVIAPQLDSMRCQIIHNDMNPGNVLVDHADANRVTGVIDFGDIVFSQLVNDVAVAGAYFCRIEDDPFAEVVEFLDAYTDVLPLTEDEIAVLPDLILSRHLTTVMISHWRAGLYPDNAEYILRSEGRARKMLYLVNGTSINDTVGRFLDVCGRAPGQEPGA